MMFGVAMKVFLLPLMLQNAIATSIHFEKYAAFKKVQEKVSFKSKLDPPTSKGERVLYPIRYGADPTGVQDSSDAILRAVSDAYRVENGRVMLAGIKDLGGVVLDFQGGSYKISKPITFAPNAGNVVVQGGSLRASDTFPGDRHLIELSTQQTPAFTTTQNLTAVGDFKTDQSNGIQYEAFTFRDILFDSSMRGGGINVANSARTRITNCYFLHFTTEGILVRGGHETFISNTFLGQQETVGGDPHERQFTATAIDLGSNDNVVTDVAIFSAAVGIVLRGQANMITGAHCYNKATGFGGVGILLKLSGLSQTRIDNCYMDYNSIVMEDPVQVHVTNGFFLGDGNIVIKSVQGKISGVNIMNNMFSGDPQAMKPIVELDGQFSQIDQVVVDHNNVRGMALRSTVGRVSVQGNKSAKWVADFSKVLLFPNKIAHFHYSFYSKGDSGIPVHAVTNVSSNVVTVETNKAVDGVVSMEVDQYNAVGEGVL